MASASSSSSSPHPPPPPYSTAEESPQQQQQEQQQEQQVAAIEKECVHKTKTISFLGRTTPIIIQNANGPCPLLAICNVLLLKNNLNLSPDISEVSQEKLLSLVAERLIDSNSNVNNKEAGYVENQQQNIADAIDLLPQLATGIDVNIKFRRIDDFEFTPECAIFDLLDIPLYHGWIVDPQDYDTANAIGAKSYNALMGELVALETQNTGDESKNNAEEDYVDFAAATTATLGVPSPCLSKATSFNDSPRSAPDDQKARIGDVEEEAELLRALKLSESDLLSSVGGSLVSDVNGGVVSVSDKPACLGGAGHLDDTDIPECIGLDNNRSSFSYDTHNLTPIETIPGKMMRPSSRTEESYIVDQSTYPESGECLSGNDVSKNRRVENMVFIDDTLSLSTAKEASASEEIIDFSLGHQKVENQSLDNIREPADISSGHDIAGASGLSSSIPESGSSSGRMQNIDTPETFNSSVDGSEPIYEGEECILDSGTSVYEDREPMYEGEVILAEQADKTVLSNTEITPQQGELIRNFLKNNANQLTFYGLFCLQDGLKERELCVFFRNNHFSTMFKYNGELYLLATDQGYINQPDLVWEKLNEVNGDTLFMTGNFKEFKVESHANETWDEHNVVASTADYLASIDSAAQSGLDINSDLQLAIALQQQEFEQQQPHSQRHNAPQPSIGVSRLITGPQAPKSNGRNTLSSKPEAKSKDKCVVM